MATNYAHRLILIVPAAKVATVVTWFQANIGANSVPADLGPGLNASGLQADPVTYRWCCGSFTDAECKAVLAKLCQLASVTPPTNAQWNGWTGVQKRSWLGSVRAAILSGYGVYVTLADNSDVWDDPAAALAALGLQTMQAGGMALVTAV
jgi:hypothetical protein